ncbi:MAG: MaoC family dehydratase [Gammaproteobacteria bacterium]|nr:MaoC family dehydratase [Gammaproteobacteria bacterium]
MYFEEFEIGQVVEHPFSRTVSEMDNTLFSCLTLNTQPLHLSEHFSQGTQHGQRIVNSLFTLGLMVGMSVTTLTLGTTLGNLSMTDIEFPRPVFHGDTLRAETRILDKRESRSKPDRGTVTFQDSAYNQHGELVARCTRVGMMLKRPSNESGNT